MTTLRKFGEYPQTLLTDSKKAKLDKEDYAYFLIELLKEDLVDALNNPPIYKDCVQSALDRLGSLTKHLKGDI